MSGSGFFCPQTQLAGTSEKLFEGMRRRGQSWGLRFKVGAGRPASSGAGRVRLLVPRSGLMTEAGTPGGPEPARPTGP